MSTKEIQERIDLLKQHKLLQGYLEKQEANKKRVKKSLDKDAAAEKKQVRESTKNYVRGSNKEKEDFDVEEL